MMIILNDLLKFYESPHLSAVLDEEYPLPDMKLKPELTAEATKNYQVMYLTQEKCIKMSQDTNRRGAKAFQKRRSSPAIHDARARYDKRDDRCRNAGWRQETAPLLPKKQDYNRHLLDGFFQFYQLASHGLKFPIF